MIPLDTIDWRVLNYLHHDGRMSNQTLADKVALSPSACLRRVKALEAAGIIEGYAARLNLKTLGLELEAMVHVMINQSQASWHADFINQIEAIPEIAHAFVVTGACNYILHIKAKNLITFSDLVINKLHQMPMVRELCSYLVLAEVKNNPRQILACKVNRVTQEMEQR